MNYSNRNVLLLTPLIWASLIFLPKPASAAAPVFCAQEGSNCVITTGIRDAFYGANGKFAHKVVESSFTCNNATFGDPNPGVAKRCYVGDANFIYRTPEWDSVPEWKNIPKNYTPGLQQLNEATPVIVAYGAAGKYASKVIGSTNCDNSSFGDPAPGHAKGCYTGPTLKKCADEGSACYLNGVTMIAYGSVFAWSTKSVSGVVACNSANFGDPAPGYSKACYADANVVMPPLSPLPYAP